MRGPTRDQGAGRPGVGEELAALLTASDDAEDIRLGEADSGSIGADFQLETVATLTAVVAALFFDGPIVPKLYSLLRRHPGTRVTIETPTRSATLEVHGKLSEESLSRVLAQLARS